MSVNKSGLSLMGKISAARASDPEFDRAHRSVQLFMAAWVGIVALDRLIGVLTHAYDGNQLLYALLGGAALVLIAFLGTRGHIQGAMMVMQINMAVCLIQFAATCFLYRENTALWSTLFYGFSAGVLIANSLVLFLSRRQEAYRAKLRQLKGKEDRAPRYYRSNNRLIRNRK